MSENTIPYYETPEWRNILKTIPHQQIDSNQNLIVRVDIYFWKLIDNELYFVRIPEDKTIPSVGWAKNEDNKLIIARKALTMLVLRPDQQ